MKATTDSAGTLVPEAGIETVMGPPSDARIYCVEHPCNKFVKQVL